MNNDDNKQTFTAIPLTPQTNATHSVRSRVAFYLLLVGALMPFISIVSLSGLWGLVVTIYLLPVAAVCAVLMLIFFRPRKGSSGGPARLAKIIAYTVGAAVLGYIAFFAYSLFS